jgi:hypothetical protein
MVHGEAYGLWNGALCAVSLLLGGKLAGLPTPGKARLLLCALLGAVGSLWQLMNPREGELALFLCLASVWICYGREGLTAFARALVTTVCAALLPGGTALALLGMGCSPALSMSMALLLALLLWTLSSLLPTAMQRVQQVELAANGQSVLLPAMLDSGNLLRDPLTSLPVMVISLRAARALFPDHPGLGSLEDLPRGFRLLSVRTAAGRGLWPVFRPERCRIYLDGKAHEAKVMVAVAGPAYEGVQALVPLAALPSSASDPGSPAMAQPVGGEFPLMLQK